MGRTGIYARSPAEKKGMRTRTRTRRGGGVWIVRLMAREEDAVGPNEMISGRKEKEDELMKRNGVNSILVEEEETEKRLLIHHTFFLSALSVSVTLAVNH